MFYGDILDNMVICKKPKLTLEELQWKAVFEDAVRKTNMVIDRWKERNSTLTIDKTIMAQDVEAVFFNFIRRPLFSDNKECRDFTKNVQVFIDIDNRHIKDIVDMSINIRENNTAFNRLLSPSEIKLEKLLEIVSNLNFKEIDKKEEIFETDIETNEKTD